MLPADEVLTAYRRHIRGDWGLLDPLDALANERGLVDGRPLVSAFKASNGNGFHVVTDLRQSTTTIMLANESAYIPRCVELA